MSIKNKKINIGDLVEVDFDYHWSQRELKMSNNLYLVVDQNISCYFVMGSDGRTKSVNKKKCRLYKPPSKATSPQTPLFP